MTEVKHFGKTLLFLSSFSPLWIIFLGNLLIKNGPVLFTSPTNETLKMFLLQWGFLFILAVSLIATGVFLREIKIAKNSRTVTIYDKENMTSEYVVYVVTYIIPFLVNNFEINEVFTLSIMLLFVGILYVKSNLIHVNPMFTIFGYRLYSITDEKLNKIHILTKRHLVRNDEIKTSMIDVGFFVDVES